MSRLFGILPLDKPPGPTSHDAVAKVRKALDIRKVGHTGTLDPFASGLLLVCVGPATRLAEYLSGRDKVYEATVRLGVTTSTHDPKGEELARDGEWRDLTPEEVTSALARFRGTLLQKPPVFSAKKVAGEPAHRRARRGEAVELAPVEVTVHELELTSFDLPRLGLRVRCSAGTYIRALARDLGQALGMGAHLAELRRTRIGAFRVEDALPFGGLDDPSRAREALVAPARAMEGFPSVDVSPDEALRLSQGQFLPLEAGPGAEDDPVAIFQDEELVAVGVVRGGELRPKKVFRGG